MNTKRLFKNSIANNDIKISKFEIITHIATNYEKGI